MTRLDWCYLAMDLASVTALALIVWNQYRPQRRVPLCVFFVLGVIVVTTATVALLTRPGAAHV